MRVPHEEIFNLESPSGSPVGYSSIDRPTDYREAKVSGISIGSKQFPFFSRGRRE
jgi:hypothetical protein